jgi:hypothetical protein
MATGKNLGSMVRELEKLSAQIDRVQAKKSELEKQYDALEMEILSSFKKADIEGVRGARSIVSVAHQTLLSIEDYPAFSRWILQHRALDLFQNRVSVRAYTERKEAGEKVPGVKEFERVYLRLRAIKKEG